jgi:hypothetical protein
MFRAPWLERDGCSKFAQWEYGIDGIRRGGKTSRTGRNTPHRQLKVNDGVPFAQIYGLLVTGAST